jgi:hypothetical protein
MTTNMDRPIFEVDELTVGEHWHKHADVFADIAEQHAEAKLDLAELEAELEVCEATLDLKIRKDPEKFGIEKIAEAAVKARITIDKKVQELQAEIRQQEHRVNVLSGWIKSLENKRKAMENIVTLRGQSYYAEPRVSQEVVRAAKEQERRASKPKKSVRRRKT